MRDGAIQPPTASRPEPAVGPAPGVPGSDVLARLCGDIEGVDREIITLVGRRVRLAREIGRVKRDAGLPVVDGAQEREVLARAGEEARAAGLPSPAVRGLMRRVITLARRAQEEDARAPGHYQSEDAE